MNKIILIKLSHLALVAACAGGLAACTTQSGPTYTMQAIVLPDQPKPVYRVTCTGLMESSDSCMAAAARKCQGQPVTPLELVDGVDANARKNDPRQITFMCGVSEAEKPAAQQQPVAQRQVLLQGDAYFATDSSVLTEVARQGLDSFIRFNQGLAFKDIVVIGYTDSTGSTAHNDRLSRARATSAIAYLRSQGILADNFSAEGRGAADPVASNATAEGRALNRRVEVRAAMQ